MPNPTPTVSYKRHRFPKEVISHAVWLYFRFSLSFRDIKEMLQRRGIIVSYEAIRCWCKAPSAAEAKVYLTVPFLRLLTQRNTATAMAPNTT